MEKLENFLKERWWLLLILVVVLALFLIPTQDGLPDNDYAGCETDGSFCRTSTIKSITKESDGSTILTVPVKISDTETRETFFHLDKYRGDWGVGNEIFMNFSTNTNRTYLFISHKSNMFMTLLGLVLNASQGSTGVVELDTGKEVKESTAQSNVKEVDSQDSYRSSEYECTDDCSGHDAGYEWAEENDVCDDSYSEGNSESFDEGVRVYAEENC